MAKTKNFSFSGFMAFSESLVDSLETISNKIEEVTNQITTLETVLEGDDAAAPTEEPVSAEENVEVVDATDANTDAEIPAEEEPTEVAVEEGVEETVPTSEEAPADANAEEVTEETPADANADASVETTAEEETAPVSDEDNDSAAIDAMSTGDENFSDKFMVVGLKNRPWGNRVIAAKDFSEKEHNKIIPTLFSTKAQAQRAMTSYNVNGPANFSIRYNHINQMFGMNNTEVKSETKVVNASESGSRYDKVKSIFGM